MRFLIDENLPTDVVDVLQSAGHEVIYVPHTSLRTSPDGTLNEFALQGDYVIVTRDLDFPLRESASVPGVILTRAPDHFRRREIGEVMRRFLLDDGNFAAVRGRVTVVSPGRSREWLRTESITTRHPSFQMASSEVGLT